MYGLDPRGCWGSQGIDLAFCKRVRTTIQPLIKACEGYLSWAGRFVGEEKKMEMLAVRRLEVRLDNLKLELNIILGLDN